MSESATPAEPEGFVTGHILLCFFGSLLGLATLVGLAVGFVFDKSFDTAMSWACGTFFGPLVILWGIASFAANENDGEEGSPYGKFG